MVWWDELHRRALTLILWHVACAYNIEYMRVSVGHPRGGGLLICGGLSSACGASPGGAGPSRGAGGSCGASSAGEREGEACLALSAYIVEGSSCCGGSPVEAVSRARWGGDCIFTTRDTRQLLASPSDGA